MNVNRQIRLGHRAKLVHRKRHWLFDRTGDFQTPWLCRLRRRSFTDDWPLTGSDQLLTGRQRGRERLVWHGLSRMSSSERNRGCKEQFSLAKSTKKRRRVDSPASLLNWKTGFLTNLGNHGRRRKNLRRKIRRRRPERAGKPGDKPGGKPGHSLRIRNRHHRQCSDRKSCFLAVPVQM
jgi:hypothetical protein